MKTETRENGKQKYLYIVGAGPKIPYVVVRRDTHL